MKHIYFYCILLLLLIGQPVWAQILNVEKDRVKGDSVNYFVGNIGIDFNANNRSINDEGETTTFVGITANSDVGYISTHHTYLFLGQFQYNAITNEPINSTGFSHFRINFLRDEKLSYETFTQLQYDQGRGMEIRWLGGGGIRYRFYNKEKSGLYMGIGAMYEREVWEFPGTEEIIRTTNIWKSTNYISQRIKLSENADFNFIAYYQTGYDFENEIFRHRISADINLLVKILAHLSLRITLNGAYENEPVVPVTKFVYSVMNGFQWSF